MLHRSEIGCRGSCIASPAHIAFRPAQVPPGNRAFEAVLDEIVGGLAVAASQGAGKAAQTRLCALRSARLDRALLFRADSENEIDERLKADPWTRSGILSTSRIARWNLRLGEVG